MTFNLASKSLPALDLNPLNVSVVPVLTSCCATSSGISRCAMVFQITNLQPLRQFEQPYALAPATISPPQVGQTPSASCPASFFATSASA